MAGSWEQQAAPSVLTAILHTDFTSIAWALGLHKLILPGPILPIAGRPFDHARNSACMRCLELGFDYLFFLDSDVIPPPDAVLRLLAHDRPVVSGIYFRRSTPAGVPVMQKPPGQWITQYPANSLIEVDVVGAGCLLIRRDVLETLPPQRNGCHWFDWRVNLAGDSEWGHLPPMSEDFTFNMHCKAHDIPTMVDTGVACKHIGLAEAEYGSFVPCDGNAA